MKASHRSLDDWLDDLLVNAEKIVVHTADLRFEQFAGDEAVRDLVTRKLEIIGEAARYIRELHPDFYAGATTLPWRELHKTRNFLIHAYFDVLPAILWETARDSVPLFLAELRRVVDNRRRETDRE
jgi:uncharacterized protein with HEPN domain